ncbi:hypothetical protein EDD15DRAFT_2332202 [Pisolithus albus]|nr:hypothetical protein EDD15DRAFT_2332202 [Pisolithus albus]
MALLCQRLTGPGYLVVVQLASTASPGACLIICSGIGYMVGSKFTHVRRSPTESETLSSVTARSLHYHASILQTAGLRAS